MCMEERIFQKRTGLSKLGNYHRKKREEMVNMSCGIKYVFLMIYLKTPLAVDCR